VRSAPWSYTGERTVGGLFPVDGSSGGSEVEAVFRSGLPTAPRGGGRQPHHAWRVFRRFGALSGQGPAGTFIRALVSAASYDVACMDVPAAGRYTIVFDSAHDGGGSGKGGSAAVSVPGRRVMRGQAERTVPVRTSRGEGPDVGEDTGTPVHLTCAVPSKSTERIDDAAIESKIMTAADHEEAGQSRREAEPERGFPVEQYDQTDNGHGIMGCGNEIC
jgi:hypothetical protein